MREIKNECSGSGLVSLSSAEYYRKEVKCPNCGKWLKSKIRRQLRENEFPTATLPRHSRKD